MATTTPQPQRDPMQAAPAPFSYNPSAWSQRVPICVLAAVATWIAAYMALYQWRLIPSVWDPLFGESSQKVLDSKVAQTMDRWIGVPDAALGAFAYLGDAVLGMAGSTRRWQYRPWLVILFGIDVIPLGVVSSVLVILQGTVVGFWCFPCLVTAAISLVLAYWAYDEVWASLVYLRQVWRDTHSVREVRLAFAGVATEAGRAAGDKLTGHNAKDDKLKDEVS